MTRYEVGELVDITIRSARISKRDSTDRIWFVLGADDAEGWIPRRPGDTASVTVTRSAPKEWPPQTGDKWRDCNGDDWFAIGAGQTLVNTLGNAFDKEDALARYGPVRLVHREGWSPTPAVPVEDQADEPVVEQPSYADSLRQLADWLDAHPTFPMPTYSSGITGALASVDRVREAASMLGAPLQDYIADSGKRHVVVEHRFGRIELRLSRVEDLPDAGGNQLPDVEGMSDRAPAEPDPARVRPVLSAAPPEQRRPCGSCDAGLPMACTCADPSDADGGEQA